MSESVRVIEREGEGERGVREGMSESVLVLEREGEMEERDGRE